jgi:hypothetical protein
LHAYGSEDQRPFSGNGRNIFTNHAALSKPVFGALSANIERSGRRGTGY